MAQPLSRPLPWLVLAVGIFCVAAQPKPARATDPFLVVPPKKLRKGFVDHRISHLRGGQVWQRLRAAHVPFKRVPAAKAKGVKYPVRLTGPIGGVWFRSSPSERIWKHSKFEILDGRLALVLACIAPLLRKHHIKEVRHASLYRPSKRGQRGIRPSKGQKTSRHPAGLAIDMSQFLKDDGSVLKVKRDFGPRLRKRTCGKGAPAPKLERPTKQRKAQARQLRKLVCDLAAGHYFTYMLTPNYNRAHHDHVHAEIKAGVPWVLVH